MLTFETSPSSMTAKWLAALSGLFMAGWLVLHVLGNFTAFSGAAAMDGYAAALRRLGPLLWLSRGALVMAVIVHVGATLSLARRARAARPTRDGPRFTRGNLSSRTMRVGGPLLLAFIVFHLLHLTFGVVHPSFEPGHVYSNLVSGLSSPWASALYVVAAGLVALHLHHGVSSALVSFGVSRAASGVWRTVLRASALVLAFGFATIPVAVLVGVLK
jgi:succinate dehydrogenase / fumarate reductase cytochrome b subunit